jgi:hypothetical protein
MLLSFPHFISFGEHVKIGLCTGYTFYGVVQKLLSIKLKSALGGSPQLLNDKTEKKNTRIPSVYMGHNLSLLLKFSTLKNSKIIL